MPYKLQESDGAYYVVNSDTGKRKNKKPLSKARALAYMRALYAVEGGAEMRGKEVAEKVIDVFSKRMSGGITSQVWAEKEGKEVFHPEAVGKITDKSEGVNDIRSLVGFISPGVSAERENELIERFIGNFKKQNESRDLVSTKMEFQSDDQRKAVFAAIADSGDSTGDPYDTNYRKEYWKLEPKKMKFSEYAAESLMSNKEPGDRNRVEKVVKFHLEKMKEFPNLSDDRQAVHMKSKRPEVSYASSQSGILYDAWRNIERGFSVSHDGKFPFASKEHIPALLVYKDAAGVDRWVTFSSNAYRDRDKEIVSTAALEADVARADKEGNYGPLRWWHVGTPDPIAQTPGPGADIGVCDFNAMHGRVLIESGTFNSPQIAQAVKEAADNLQVSIGYFHPRTEPDAAGVFNSIKRFERSLLPAGRASNPFTGLSVIQKSDGGDTVLKEKFQALAALLKDDELVNSVLAQAEAKEKEAQQMMVDFKETEEEPPAAPAVEVETKNEAEMDEDADIPDEPFDADLEPTIGMMTADTFAGMLAEAMDKAMEPHRKELEAVKASMKTKDDSEAALREALELQAQTIGTLKSQLDELTGSQPRAATKGYRDSQSADTVVKDDSKVKGSKPTVDPDFVKMFLPQ